jgi:hypothetical protein
MQHGHTNVKNIYLSNYSCEISPKLKGVTMIDKIYQNDTKIVPVSYEQSRTLTGRIHQLESSIAWKVSACYCPCHSV